MPECHTNDLSVLHSNIAIALMKMGNYVEAEDACCKALDLNSKLVKARANRAECFFQQKKFQSAVDGELTRL